MKAIQELSYSLFNSVVTDEKENKLTIKDYIREFGPLFIIKRFNSFSMDELIEAVDVVKSFLVDGDETNKTFYKNWKNITDKTRLELFIDQVLHYLTTYGMELKGDDVYLPDRDVELNIPDLELENVKIIETITLDMFLDKLIDFIQTDIAIDSNTVNLIGKAINEIILLGNIEIKTDLVKRFSIMLANDNIKNRELKILVMDKLKIIPKDIDEWFRYLVYKTTDNTLVVKNNDTFDSLQNNPHIVKNAIQDYIATHGKYEFVNKAAESFNRYKPLWLSIKIGFKNAKCGKDLITLINKISKKSKKLHKPKGIPDYLKITSEKMKTEKLLSLISGLNTSYLIKIYSALNVRLLLKENNIEIARYKVRTGKDWWDMEFNNTVDKLGENYVKNTKDIIKTIIEDRIRRKLKDENIELKEGKLLNLALPTSGKKFIGNIPVGSIVNTDLSSLQIGIYWENINNKRVDLDLSLTNETESFGWYSDYYDDEETVIYSGDMTDAKNGATEAFLITFLSNNSYRVKVNWFNSSDFKVNEEIEFKFFIAKTNEDYLNSVERDNYMVNPNDIVFSTKIKLKANEKGMTIGYLIGNEFVFDSSIINANISRLDAKDVMKYLKISRESLLKFSDLNLNIDLDETKEKNVLDLDNPEKSKFLELVS